jgi:UPF0042 nucleotide-binding protein
VNPSAAPARSVGIVVVTGMSGSGKSTAINALEDEGYYCIDNLPTALVPRFVELCADNELGMPKVGLGLDIRDVSYAETWPRVREVLEAAGHTVEVVFLDAADDVLLRRFSETRRAHPLGVGVDLTEAIQRERAALKNLKEKAEIVVDTSSMSIHDLKRRLRELVSGRESGSGLAITVKSFGYKYGIAGDADLTFDVRFLPNPHFVDALRAHTGLDADVAAYVLDRQETKDFIAHLRPLLDFLLPRYAREGRSYLTIGIGCTGGRHRSVAIAEEVGKILSEGGYAVIVRHRDVDRGPS